MSFAFPVEMSNQQRLWNSSTLQSSATRQRLNESPSLKGVLLIPGLPESAAAIVSMWATASVCSKRGRESLHSFHSVALNSS